MNNETSSTVRYTKYDLGLAISMLLCGFLYWNLIFSFQVFNIGVTIFAGIFCLTVAIYLKVNGIHQTRRGLIGLAVVLISALAFSLFDNGLIKGLNFIFLSLSTVYWIGIVTAGNLEDRLSIYGLGDLYNQVLISPFQNFTSCFGCIKEMSAGTQKGKGILSGLLGIILIIPVLLLVINLLTKADAAFEDLITLIKFNISEDLMTYLLQMLMGLPVACYLYGLIYGNRYQRKKGLTTIESMDKTAVAMRIMPGATIYSALTALNLVFVVFFLTQIKYIFSAFSNHLPELMTYAEYARRGFFELCAVAAINLFVIAFVHIMGKREKVRILQIETAALCLFTLMLIITAISKMVMYISYYGLTQLRVYTTWFMLLLLYIFVVVMLREFRKFNAAKVIIIGFVAFFMVLNYGNIDGQIAKYNIARYEKGSLEKLDVPALFELSDAAVPHIYDLYQNTSDASLKSKIKDLAVEKGKIEKEYEGEKTFRDFNLESYRAEKIWDEFLADIK